VLSWGDALPRAIGHGMQTLDCRTPTILNLAWGATFFWDGRADTLEAQALGPIQAAGEMNLDLGTMVKRIAAIEGYRTRFAAAYPGEPIEPATVAKAIATFERGVVSADAPFDRWILGEEDAIGLEARRGFIVFNTKGNCAKCHSGWRFTDDSFHDFGVPGHDLGRGAVLKDIPSVRHAFKTPTLRDVDRRAPYMHDGSRRSGRLLRSRRRGGTREPVERDETSWPHVGGEAAVGGVPAHTDQPRPPGCHSSAAPLGAFVTPTY